MTEVVKFCFVHPEAKRPAYAKPGDSGMDVFTTADIVLPPLRAVAIPTGCAFALPEGYEWQVRPKSGYSGRNILCHLGTCDEQYRGEVLVILTLIAHPDADSFRIAKGLKVAQIVLAKVARAELVQVASVAELGTTERGAGGFGSSGLL